MSAEIILGIVFSGLAGGFLSTVVSGAILELPTLVVLTRGENFKDSNSGSESEHRNNPSRMTSLLTTRWGCELGCLSEILLGGGAAFAFWAIVTATGHEPQVYGAAFISGFGGLRVLTWLYERQFEAKNERDQLADALGVLLVDEKEGENAPDNP